MIIVTVRNPFFALSAALSLAACTLPTKLAELSDGSGDGADSGSGSGSGSGEPSDTSGGDPATTGDSSPINSGGTVGESSGGEPKFDLPADSEGCTPATVTHTPLHPNVVLVLDKSGSMVSGPGGLWDHDGDAMTADVTRWSSLHAVVDSVLTDFGDVIDFGAHLFPGPTATPNYDASACQLDATISVAVAPANEAAILAAIPDAGDNTLRGGTPAAAAVGTAIDHLKTLDPAVPRAIVLVTDGAANCAGDTPPELFEDYDPAVHALVDDAFAIDGIPTYVVGIGIVDSTSPVKIDGAPDAINTFDKLNQLAEEGGKPRADPDEKFHNSTDQSELAAALAEIASDATSCVVPLGQAVADPQQTSVEIDSVAIAQVGDCLTEDGWVYTAPGGPFDAIELCGAACDALKSAGSADVTACLP